VILKDKILTNPSDPRLRAGEVAEKQMAFYLKRAFRKRDDCFVINDLRVIYDGDVAQVDHLIVSNYGLFIVESKSVHGTISINPHGDWLRTYNKQVTGMPSPVLQAQEQGRIIKELLSNNTEQLLGKMLFGQVQKGFGYCPVCVYVAISDSGIIKRGMDVGELFKADVVAGAITKKLDELSRKSKLLSPKNLLSTDVIWDMNKDEAKAVAEFLISEHTDSALPVETNKVSTGSKHKPELISMRQSKKSFVPKIGALCPECGQLNLIRKIINRSDGTETDFLACQGYPVACKALFPLIAVVHQVAKSGEEIAVDAKLFSEGMPCPRCKDGELVKRKAKTEFLGCSKFPKCRFTDYRDQPS